ncbi:tetratricopeptide repeat protein [Lysobacter auxotrophicus]|uniref:Winged helix-turn-helix domain-containing protein n=1 Tax=Lysobacter auxotrophicus TaxID=2992573 RepID=A0ABN6UI21_9GAMM|nr:tetratricopeptide repeat protein [Lysobacter auxotrophicus]BDU15952.1 winged helix-turn-helix domain-containing protein [Lysobacter auxotrophicus]
MTPHGSAGQGGPNGERYRFGDILVDAAAHTLSRAGTEQTVEPKAFSVLLILLRHAGELVGRDDLLDQVWGHRHVTPGVLTRVIAQLRHALADDSQHPRYIQTQHALGYRFIGQFHEADSPSHATEDARHDEGVAVFRHTVPDALIAAANEAVAPAPEPAPFAAPVPTNGGDFATRRKASDQRRWWLAVAALLAIAAGGYWFGQHGPGSATSVPAPAAASVAVLPFTSLSEAKDEGYFAEGLGVEMVDALAGVPGLKVVAAPSPPGRGEVDVKRMGAQLGVATVLGASVRREGARVRVSARLSDARTGFTLWAHSYDRETGDVFALQSDIAGEVVQALIDVLPSSEIEAARQSLARRLTPTRSVAAYDAYLKGEQRMRERAGGDLRGADSAINFYRGALAIDPGFARAQAGICQAEIARFEDARDSDAFTRAQAACEQATKMDPSLHEVSLAMGDLYRAQGNAKQAVAYYERAVDEPALRVHAYLGLATVASAQGQGEQAMAYFERARELAPRDPKVAQKRGYHLLVSGDFPGAIASYREALDYAPDDAALWSSLGGLYAVTGDPAKAIEAYERSLQIKPSYEALSNLGSVKFDQGAYEQAAALYRHASEIDPGDFRIWGNLGDALTAAGSTAVQTRAQYEQAATLGRRYLQLKSDDAQGLALVAWYAANLDLAGEARTLQGKAESLGTERAEVALLGAQTMARLGDADAARRHIDFARKHGIPQQRIDALPLLRSLTAKVEPSSAREPGTAQ